MVQDGGKVSSEFLRSVVLTHVGSQLDDVLIGPMSGHDCGIIDLNDGRVLTVTSDPLYVFPPFGWDRAAWFAVQILLSDSATSGIAPTHLSICLNVPLSCSDDDLSAIWTGIHRFCRQRNVAVITGHTGRYEGCSFPMIGAATVIGIGAVDRYVVPSMAESGDHVIVTKGPTIETVGSLGFAAPEYIASLCGVDVAREASGLFNQMSVVDDAMVAASIGVRENGVTGMHDATERGLRGALVEVAEASGCGMIIWQDRIVCPDVVRSVCGLFGIDPFNSSSEGSLVITCGPSQSERLVRTLSNHGIRSSVIGELTDARDGKRWVCGAREAELVEPEIDPFWPALQDAFELEESMRLSREC